MLAHTCHAAPSAVWPPSTVLSQAVHTPGDVVADSGKVREVAFPPLPHLLCPFSSWVSAAPYGHRVLIPAPGMETDAQIQSSSSTQVLLGSLCRHIPRLKRDHGSVSPSRFVSKGNAVLTPLTINCCLPLVKTPNGSKVKLWVTEQDQGGRGKALSSLVFAW